MKNSRVTELRNSIKKARDIKVLKILSLVSLPFFPLFCFFMLELMNFRRGPQGVLDFVEISPMTALFSVTLLSVIYVILLLICRKAAIANGILGLLSILFAYTNYAKVMFNGDNFFPADIIAIGNIGNVTQFISWEFMRWFWMCVVVTILWVIALWFFKSEIPLNWKIRLPVAAVVAAAVVFMFYSPQRSEAVMESFGLDPADSQFNSYNYNKNGFIAAFTINAVRMNIKSPTDYSQEMIRSLLDGFYETPMTGEAFDIIVVLSESFFDVRLLDVEFSSNPLPNFDRITQKPAVYSGMVYTTALFANTARPEFDILTGLTTDNLPSGTIPFGLMTREMPTYVSNYRDAGYQTIAIHPHTASFYTRDIGYPLIGFDEFLCSSILWERFDTLEMWRERFVSDMSLIQPIKEVLDNADVPIFLWVITMQNHHPFSMVEGEQARIEVTSETLDADTLRIVKGYTQGLYEADKMLGALTDYIDEREQPTVLLFFGDHLPTLRGLEAYIQSGFVCGGALDSMENRMRLYSTPFLIYSNHELKPDILVRGTDNHVSTYYLLALIAEMTGFQRTQYMNFLLDFFPRVPFYNSELNQPRTEDIEELSRAMALITYDRLVGNMYSSQPEPP